MHFSSFASRLFSIPGLDGSNLSPQINLIFSCFKNHGSKCETVKSDSIGFRAGTLSHEKYGALQTEIANKDIIERSRCAWAFK